MAPSNALPIHGNEKTMNLNHLILTNIQSSPYFKVNLYELKTYHEVIDEIYYKVDHLEPWEKGSRKTAGQTGMCGGVRGVGAGGIVSSAYCLLYKLFTLKLTRKQLNGLITHSDSPYIRGLGFMYIRYTQPPADLWDYFGKYLEDDEELDVKAGGGQIMCIGELCRQWLFKIEWYSTLFPRIPVPVQKMIQMKLREYDAQHARAPMAEVPEEVGEAEGLEGEGEQEPNYGQAERMSRNQGSDREADRGEHESTKDREINRDRESNRSDRESNRGDRESNRGDRESNRVDRESNRGDREKDRGDRDSNRGDRERDRVDRESNRGDRERDRGDRESNRGDRGDRGSNRGDRERDRGDRERGRGDRERERDRDRYQQPGGFDVAQEIQREKERQRKEKERGSRERDRGVREEERGSRDPRDREKDRHRDEKHQSRERYSNDAKGRERREVSPSYERRDRHEKKSWTPERPRDNHHENRDPERLERKRSHSQEHKRSRSHERKKSRPEEGRQSKSPEHREKKEKHKHKHKHKSKSGDKESKSKRDREDYRNGKH